MPQDAITLIPYGEDPLLVLARDVLSDFSEQLPDLSQVTVLLSEPQAAKRFRRILLQQAEQQGHYALLCPRITNLRDWAQAQLHQAQNKPLNICGQHQRELILFDVLTQHKTLLGSGSPWNLTDDLLKLFDQLTLNKKTLADDYDSFENEIARAYGIDAKDFPSLGREASLVYTLWQAWHTQLNAEDILDKEAAYVLGLNTGSQNNKTTLYIAGYHNFSMTEQTWLKKLIEQQYCRLYLHGQSANSTSEKVDSYHPDTPINKLADVFHFTAAQKQNNHYTNFINACYANESQPLLKRATEFATQPSQEISQRLKLLFTKSHEEQAHAVELQVRRWLLQGKTNIGIITENRRLARRVRALLERADVPLQDYAGWALSTTRAGAVLERWLECIEEDFSHLPLLDLLKSPFIFSDLDSLEVRHAAYRLEHDIIRQENIARNLQRYTKFIHLRAERLQWSSEVSQILLQILERFESAEKILKPLVKGSHEAIEYITQLETSLELLGMTALLQQDAAGARVVEMLDTLKHSAQKYNLKMNWADFRAWVGRGLEQFVFTTEVTDSPVTLMGLGQSRLQQFDALIIASAEQENLPGQANITPFFNNAVRKQLNLSTTQDMLTDRFHHFRRLLESAPEIYITANDEENGEQVPLSPWLEIIHRFYVQAFQHSLQDEELKQLLSQSAAEVIRCSEMAVPEKTIQPKPSATPVLLPKRYSPSSYQQLMNCPYQFFAAQCLQLAPSEEIQQALSKSDYGERIHLCLQCFHSEQPQQPGPFSEELPGPFKEKLTQQNRNAAINMLNEISHKVFARDVAENFEHAGWLEQWLKQVPEYIDWQIKQASEWQLFKTEHKSHIPWQAEIELVGRLDRIDKNDSGLSIIDYKTGQSANLVDIEQGEAVQLPFYALLAEAEFKSPIQQVSYLNLDKKVKTGTHLSAEPLQAITQQIAERLAALIDEMNSKQSLPAWGDEKTCGYCDMERLCRKQAWNN